MYEVNLERAMNYWMDLLDDYTNIAKIPNDFFYKDCSDEVVDEVFKMNIEKHERLIQYSKVNNISIDSIIETIYGLILQKYIYEDDVVFGKTMNIIPIRVRVRQSEKFIDVVRKLKRQWSRSLEYGYYLLSDIENKNHLNTKLINTIFIAKSFDLSYDYDIEKKGYDLSVIVYTKRALKIKIKYKQSIYKRETIRRILNQFDYIIEQIIEDNDILIEDLEFVCKEEEKVLLEDFNNNQYEIPYDKSYVDLFREQVKVTPSNIAARDENRKLTYKELDEVTDKLAGYLNHIGVESEDIVAVMLPRDINIIITAIGIMKSGGAFFPIDTSNPEERLNYLLEDSNAKVVITTDELKSKVVNENTIVLDINDEEMFKLGYELTEKITSSNCAYTISTSGSTGRPKTIAIEHKSLVNMCYYSVKSISATENDICGIYLSFSFDAVMKQLFPYLLVGASIDIMPEEAKFDEYTVNEYCEENDITILALPTAFARLFIQNCNNNSLRVVQTGGERLKGYRKRNYELYNEYGPTEFTVVSTSFHVDREYGKIPIGKPIFNTYAYVLDKKNKLCPIGAPGELCLSGIQISRGYLNKKGLTEQVFVENPYKTCEHNKLMYRTGDLVRWLDDGNLDYIGRMDNQVKIDEFRIELYEIENIINNITEIKSVVCISRTNDDGDMYICAYYVIDEEDSGKINERTIREYLNEHLPPYMIPTIIMRIDKIPVTPIGKVNKRALPE